MRCEWCEGKASTAKGSVYWELPDGSRAIEITKTPAIICKECEKVYQEDKVIKDIEDQLFLVDTKVISNSNKF